MKLGLIAKDSDQNRAIGEPLDVKPQRFQRCKKRIGQLTAYADLVGKAHCSAPVHDRGFWLIPIEVLSDMWPPRAHSHTLVDNGTVLSVGHVRHHSSGVIFEDRRL